MIQCAGRLVSTQMPENQPLPHPHQAAHLGQFPGPDPAVSSCSAPNIEITMENKKKN